MAPRSALALAALFLLALWLAVPPERPRPSGRPVWVPTPHCANPGVLPHCQVPVPPATLTARLPVTPRSLPTPWYAVERR